MKLIFLTSLIVLLIPLTIKIQAQEKVSIKVVSQEKPKPFYSHLGLIDRKVTYRLTNESNKPIIVYGIKIDGKVLPSGYFLKYDEKSGEWTYPTRDNKPLEWRKRSSLEKETVILCPKEYLAFDNLFSSETDSKYRFKITAYVSLEKDSNPIEIFSEEFRIEN